MILLYCSCINSFYRNKEIFIEGRSVEGDSAEGRSVERRSMERCSMERRPMEKEFRTISFLYDILASSPSSMVK